MILLFVIIVLIGWFIAPWILLAAPIVAVIWAFFSMVYANVNEDELRKQRLEKCRKRRYGRR